LKPLSLDLFGYFLENSSFFELLSTSLGNGFRGPLSPRAFLNSSPSSVLLTDLVFSLPPPPGNGRPLLLPERVFIPPRRFPHFLDLSPWLEKSRPALSARSELNEIFFSYPPPALLRVFSPPLPFLIGHSPLAEVLIPFFFFSTPSRLHRSSLSREPPLSKTSPGGLFSLL